MRKVASAIDPGAESQGSDLEIFRAPTGVSSVNKDIEVLFHQHLRDIPR